MASKNDADAMHELHRKIERERNIINAANQMRQATNNPGVNSRVDSQIRDARRNIQYFETTLRDIQTRSDLGGMSLSGGGPPPPQHGLPPNGQSGRGGNNVQGGYGAQQADYGAPGPGGYSMGAGNGMMPPRAPYAPPGPQDRSPRQRPNYSKLGMLHLDLVSMLGNANVSLRLNQSRYGTSGTTYHAHAFTA